MKTKIIAAFCFCAMLTVNTNAQHAAGTYLKVDSTWRTLANSSQKILEVDSTLLCLHEDFTFSYKWSPQYGPNAHQHVVTTGTWKPDHKKVLLTSKYQFNESRFFETYEPSYGDSLVKIYVQTYDSLIGYIQFNYVTVTAGSQRENKIVTADSQNENSSCTASFPMKKLDNIRFCGEFGQMAAVTPKNQKSNHFVLQYNWAQNADYRYFNNEAFYLAGDEIFTGKKRDASSASLKKINNLK